MKVKCIDNEDRGSGCELVLGKVYEVSCEHPNKKDWYLSGHLLSWHKTRFQVVDDTPIQEPECACGIRQSACDYHKKD